MDTYDLDLPFTTQNAIASWQMSRFFFGGDSPGRPKMVMKCHPGGFSELTGILGGWGAFHQTYDILHDAVAMRICLKPKPKLWKEKKLRCSLAAILFLCELHWEDLIFGSST